MRLQFGFSELVDFISAIFLMFKILSRFVLCLFIIVVVAFLWNFFEDFPDPGRLAPTSASDWKTGIGCIATDCAICITGACNGEATPFGALLRPPFIDLHPILVAIVISSVFQGEHSDGRSLPAHNITE